MIDGNNIHLRQPAKITNVLAKAIPVLIQAVWVPPPAPRGDAAVHDKVIARDSASGRCHERQWHIIPYRIL